MPTRTQPDFAVRTKGLREFITAADAADRATKKLVRDELRKAAEPVRDAAQQNLQDLNPTPDDTRYGISVRRIGLVTVERRRRKTTGKRWDWGRIQMREALYPAAETEEDTVVSRLEVATDTIADRLERSP